MRKGLLLLVVASVVMIGLRAVSQHATRSACAGVPPAGASPVPGGQRGGGGGGAPQDDGSPKHVPGSTQAFTLTQIRDGFNIADWFPEDHPKPPDIVMTGRRPDARACGLCHYPNGRGRPENAGLDGLPSAYFTQQIADFKRDLRKSAETRKTNTAIMTAIAKALTVEEVKASAETASLKRTAWIRVVEAATVPKTRLSGGMFLPLEGSETEPIGDRIIEVPEHPDQTELRDSRSGFVAYAPVGSLKKGEALVTTGGGRTIACRRVPRRGSVSVSARARVGGTIAQLPARQLYDMQAGTRKGLWSDLMKAVVVKLTPG
jgi:cytochrome c553